ncbi:MAG: hypothetical protein WCP79_12995 [Bacillota bacterium]
MAGLIIIIVFVVLFRARVATAYYNHSLVSHAALKDQEYLQIDVEVEDLQTFLSEEYEQVVATLDMIDNWAIKNIDDYRSLPPDLKFSNANAEDLLTAFLEAIRVNPMAYRDNYLQIVDTDISSEHWQLTGKDICLADYKYSFPYIRILPGQRVSALDVVSTASDEPDYGLDMGLWENNGTRAGSRYGFGKQPFANHDDLVQSQASFHLSFMHDKLLRMMSKPMRGNHSLLRIKTYSELAKLAKRTGHNYWACRFSGRAVHYIQDLTVPFHASMTPGYSFLRVVATMALKVCGYSKPYVRMFMNIACIHVMFEVMHYEQLNQTYLNRDKSAFIYCSLTGKNSNETVEVNDFYARDVVSKEAYRLRYRSYYAVNSLVTDTKEFENVLYASANSIYNCQPIWNGAKIIDKNEFSRVLNIVVANSGRHTRNFINHLLK